MNTISSIGVDTSRVLDGLLRTVELTAAVHRRAAEYIGRLEQENSRLRSVLEEIAAAEPRQGDSGLVGALLWSEVDCSRCEQLITAAREGLGDKCTPT